MNSSLLGLWRMQHRMDLALILKALSPSLRPSFTRCTTSSGVTSPLHEENTVKTRARNELNLIHPSLKAQVSLKVTTIHIQTYSFWFHGRGSTLALASKWGLYLTST